MPKPPVIVMHVDMDSFFASLEIARNPGLARVPVIVGADPKGGQGRGVVSTCSYEARRYGVHSAMPISRAFSVCPDAVFLPVDLAYYHEASERIMEILREHSSSFLQVSIDEAYLTPASALSYEDARVVAGEIKEAIGRAEAITCSVGIGPTRVVAKIASGYIKPDGLTIVRPDSLAGFLGPMPVGRIPGIGPKAGAVLFRMDIHTIADLAACDVQRLIGKFGRWGIEMHRRAHGLDSSRMRMAPKRHSIGRERTFQEDTDDPAVLGAVLDRLAAEAYLSLAGKGLQYRTLTLKLRYRGFTTKTHSHTLDRPACDLESIGRCSHRLLEDWLENKPVRLIGIRLSGLAGDRTIQRTIFEY